MTFTVHCSMCGSPWKAGKACTVHMIPGERRRVEHVGSKDCVMCGCPPNTHHHVGCQMERCPSCNIVGMGCACLRSGHRNTKDRVEDLMPEGQTMHNLLRVSSAYGDVTLKMPAEVAMAVSRDLEWAKKVRDSAPIIKNCADTLRANALMWGAVRDRNLAFEISVQQHCEYTKATAELLEELVVMLNTLSPAG